MMHEQSLFLDRKLPLVISPNTDAHRSTSAVVEWIRTQRASVEEKLQAAGAILLRGFAIEGAEDFEQVGRAVCSHLQNYIEGQSQREKISDKIYNSTYYPPEERITLHNELSYTNSPPRYILFHCAKPAGDGGETPVVDCRHVLSLLNKRVLGAFENRQILYVKNMHGGKGFGKSWQDHFETDDRHQVEIHLQQNGVDYTWKEDGGLRTGQTRPAIAEHPATGERIWFNQASLWHVSDIGPKGQTLRRLLGDDNLPTHVTFEDGQAIPYEFLDAVRSTMWNHASHFAWQRGDVLVVDNFLVAHGRNRYAGDRLILVAMG